MQLPTGNYPLAITSWQLPLHSTARIETMNDLSWHTADNFKIHPKFKYNNVTELVNTGIGKDKSIHSSTDLCATLGFGGRQNRIVKRYLRPLSNAYALTKFNKLKHVLFGYELYAHNYESGRPVVQCRQLTD